jgi:hypothetical protein
MLLAVSVAIFFLLAADLNGGLAFALLMLV